MKKFFEGFKKNLADIPTKEEQASKGKFIALLVLLLLMPVGTFLCLMAFYFKFRNCFNKVWHNLVSIKAKITWIQYGPEINTAQICSFTSIESLQS